MSRIGKSPISIPDKVEFNNQNNVVSVSGPKGKLQYTASSKINISVVDNKIEVSRNFRGTPFSPLMTKEAKL